MDEVEIIAKGIVLNKEPGYLYFIDSEGNICKRKKEGMKHTYKEKKKIYTEINLTIPKVLIKGYISSKPKTVRSVTGGQAGILSMPKGTIGMKGRVIIIPEEELNIHQDTVNIF